MKTIQIRSEPQTVWVTGPTLGADLQRWRLHQVLVAVTNLCFSFLPSTIIIAQLHFSSFLDGNLVELRTTIAANFGQNFELSELSDASLEGNFMA